MMGIRPTPGLPGACGIAIAHPPRARRKVRRRLACAATLASCLTCGLLAVPAIASATVDQTSAQWAELGPFAYTSTPVLSQQSQQDTSALYTIQNTAESGNKLLEDNNNAMSNGSTVDVWDQVNQTTNQDPGNIQTPGDGVTSDPNLPITQANELWEFVPDANNSGGSITTGYGELINRQSGLCLDVNGNDTADGAVVDQWQCVPGASNEQWTAIKYPGGYGISSQLDNDALGVGNGPTCAAQNDGDRVYMRTNGQGCLNWNIQQASYDFATYPISAGMDLTSPNTDNRSYECVTRYNLRESNYAPSVASDKQEYSWDYDNLSQSGTDGNQVSLFTATTDSGINSSGYTNPNEIAGGTFYYWHGDDPYWLTGQVMLYCDPPNTSP